MKVSNEFVKILKQIIKIKKMYVTGSGAKVATACSPSIYYYDSKLFTFLRQIVVTFGDLWWRDYLQLLNYA